MDGSFFDAKRPWSKYKDLLLKFYLDPYIAKVGQLKKGGRPIPVLIVDSFAGRGRFADGSPGSPILIADAVRKWRGKGIDVSAQFIEADSGNFDALRRELSGYGTTLSRHAERSKSHSQLSRRQQSGARSFCTSTRSTFACLILPP